ncbi:MAG: dTDP-4-dehydrorhamnose 3,5-epimerase [Cyclobacteriaceae bacterium]|nr:dTDP-4-dehydrorhamnose 3,5-epimerase [Cyclobacteriaceae bacterium]
MEIKETGIEGLLEIFPSVYHDNRGWFTESHNEATFKSLGLNLSFVQDNLSFSKKGVMRGLHFQKPPFAQGKLIKVIAGRVLDVALDIRPESPSFGKHYAIELSGEQQNMFYLPEGFAHGFLALEDSYLFYKCTRAYHKESDSGIYFNDPSLLIDWGITATVISEKDKNLPTFNDYKASLGLR